MDVLVKDVCGLKGLAIIADICNGNLDTQKLAAHRHGNCRKSYNEIAKALIGNNRKHDIFCLKQEYDSYLFFQKKIADCEKQINYFLKVQINTDPVKKTLCRRQGS